MDLQYRLNGKDLYSVFGVIVEKGSEQFLAFPERKQSLEHNWPEEDGIDKDLNEPAFEAREFRLSCAMVTQAGRNDFKQKWDALFTELSRLGEHTLYIADLDYEFKVYYKKQEGVTKLGPLSEDKIGVKFILVLGETNPDDNIDYVYLVDDEDNYLIV